MRHTLLSKTDVETTGGGSGGYPALWSTQEQEMV